MKKLQTIEWRLQCQYKEDILFKHVVIAALAISSDRDSHASVIAESYPQIKAFAKFSVQIDLTLSST